jgi:hypothetical protein
MLVTFLYELPRMVNKRPFSKYLQQLRKLLTIVQNNGIKIRVFLDDDETWELCTYFSCCVPVRRPRSAWWASGQKESIISAMKHRKNRFSVPEFCDEDYVTLMLCKFEALHVVSMDTMEACFWVDAGLLDSMFRETLEDQVPSPGIHAVQFSALPPCEAWIYEFPGAHIMGGCFGGHGPDVRRLFLQSKDVLHKFWEQGISLNDQQLLSVLHVRAPSQFRLRRQYIQWIPLWSRGLWNRVLCILDTSIDESVGSWPLVFLVVCLALCMRTV